MADIKISQLPAASSLASGDVLPVVQGGATKQATFSQVAALVATSALVAPNTQTGTSYTAVLADAGKKVRMNNAAANTLTIPPNSSVAYPVGTVIGVRQVGAGETTVAPGSGVTINTPTGYQPKAGRQGAELMLHKVATDEWDLTGDVKAS